uniref:Uncharacterized protein n=1 Tax=Quercus lobata TaxID=97700 RepID=A0A7N2LPI8_QUELO
MRRSASRKTGQPNSTPSLNSSPADLFRSASSKATTKELERIDALYYSYANGSSAMIEAVVGNSSVWVLWLRLPQSPARDTMATIAFGEDVLVGYTLIWSTSEHRSLEDCPSLLNLESFVGTECSKFIIDLKLVYFQSFPEGIEALCSDMEVDHTDVRILMLAWFHPFVKTDDYTYQENES